MTSTTAGVCSTASLMAAGGRGRQYWYIGMCALGRDSAVIVCDEMSRCEVMILLDVMFSYVFDIMDVG